jgi:hypothetical protein
LDSSLHDWTSLEVAKLAVSLITPLAVVWIGFRINRKLKDIEQLHWANQKIVERRIQFYFEVVPSLNEILCFFTYVGTWQETTPAHILALKRKLDRAFYINAPLFPSGVMESYFALMRVCYKTFTGWGEGAKIRSDFSRRKAFSKDWQDSWDAYFAVEDACPTQDVHVRYNMLIEVLAEALGVGIRAPVLPSGRIPRVPNKPKPTPAE